MPYYQGLFCFIYLTRSGLLNKLKTIFSLKILKTKSDNFCSILELKLIDSLTL
ncbi:hypothetical protein GGR21_000460 [Dysgonomonas hofstadii]|uniref:Uncharacterized protein n=1 Tax=Dysgonomonas hofstadii TaxID=637886 RepID=A0A840CS50_9BACT|nr:hypothetical protein [Dysgonomonas hofstadii]